MTLLSGGETPIVIAALVLGTMLELAALATRSANRGAETLAALGVILPLGTAAWAWRCGIGVLVEAVHLNDESTRVESIARALNTELSTAAVLSFGMVPISALAGMAIALRLHRRLHADAARAGGFAVLASILGGAALVTLFAGAACDAVMLTQGFSAMAGIDPASKPLLLRECIVEARNVFMSSAIVASVLGVLAFGAGTACVRTLIAPVSGGSTLTAGVLVIASLALVIEAWPCFLENTAPPLPMSALPLVSLAGVEAPDLEGPDSISHAPVLSLFSDRMTIEAVEVDDRTLADKLREIRTVDRMMFPDRAFEGRFALVADRSIQTERLSRALEACAGAGYVHGTLAFVTHETTTRPLLGTFKVSRTSGAAFDLVEPEEAGVERITLTTEDSFSAIAERVVRARRDGRFVFLAYRREPPR